MLTTVDIKIPIPRVKYGRYWNHFTVTAWWFGLLGFAALASLAIGGAVRLAHPPKVVTKTVTSYATPMNQTMQAFADNCKKSENNSGDHGIPNLSTKPWRCQYADN